jgi:Protein of unknown function (DUF998)
VKDWRAVSLVAVAVVAALFYSNFLLDVIFSREDDWFAVVSELEIPGSHNATLLRTTDVLCGLFVLVLLPFVRSALPVGGWRGWAVWMTVVFAVTGAVAGIVPLPCGPGEVCTSTADELQRWTHDAMSFVSQAAIFLGAVAVGLDTRRLGPVWLNRAAWTTFWVGGVIATVLFGYYGALDPRSWQTGIAQRFQIGVTSAWIICLGIFAATAGLRARDERSARR